LSKENEDRYQKVEELQKDLQNYIDGFATIAESATFFTHLMLLIKRHKVVTALTISFAIIFSVVVSLNIKSINKQKDAALKAKQAAVIARKQAVASKELAEERLETLQQKSNYIASLTKQVAPMCLTQAYSQYNENMFYNSRNTLKLALSFDPELAQGWYFKLQQLTAEQRFHEVAEMTKKHKAPKLMSWKIFDGAARLAKLKEDNKKLWSYSSILSLTKLVSKFDNEAFIRDTYHNINNRVEKPTQHFPILKKLLKIHNPNLKTLNFSYVKVDKGWDIDISNNPELVDISPLCGLRIVKLKMENTGIKTISCISQWTLKELYCANSPVEYFIGRDNLQSCEIIDLSNTNYSDLSFLYAMPNLKKLYLGNIPIPYPPNMKRATTLSWYVDSKYKGGKLWNLADLKSRGFDIHFIDK
jgi:eukaryotic-like serine/threonine-protein kinase